MGYALVPTLSCSCKGEECIPQTWDMFHEKWGFMVIFWNFAGVPFVSLCSRLIQCLLFILYRRRPTFFRLSTWPHTNRKSTNSRQPRTSHYSPLYLQHITCKAMNASHSCRRSDIAISAGTPPCRKRVGSRCKPRAFSATVGHSLSYHGAQSRILHTFKRSMGTEFITLNVSGLRTPLF
jgi:hypothetical protein